MESIQDFVDSQLIRGRGYFSKESALSAMHRSPEAFQAAASRLVKKHRLISPRRGFYVILRPEDRSLGAPDPARWIDPLMQFLGVDYRISLLRAASFHGSSHQAAMVFQVIAPKQLEAIEVGRQRVEFIYQSPLAFKNTNRPEWLKPLKTEAGFAKVAGIELTLLDVCRYFHHAAGINGAAQIVHDLGKEAEPRVLAEAASAYENSAVRRLGYLFDHFGHERQGKALLGSVRKAKSFVALDPSVKPIVSELAGMHEKNVRWKLDINMQVEIDT